MINRMLSILFLVFCLNTAGLAQKKQADKANNKSAETSKKDQKPVRVTWNALSKFDFVRENGKYAPKFAEEIQKLDGKKVEIEGFMVPLETSGKQTSFILSKIPFSECFFCGSDEIQTLIEVRLQKPAAFKLTSVVVSGALELLTDDPMGMVYRINDAIVIF